MVMDTIAPLSRAQRRGQEMAGLAWRLDLQHRGLLGSLARLRALGAPTAAGALTAPGALTPAGALTAPGTPTPAGAPAGRRESLRQALAEVHRLVYYHFCAERTVLEMDRCPGRWQHLADHDRLKSKLDEFLLLAESDSVDLEALGPFLSFVDAWWKNHSAQFDTPLFGHLGDLRKTDRGPDRNDDGAAPSPRGPRRLRRPPDRVSEAS